MMTTAEPSQPLTDAELAAIRDTWDAYRASQTERHGVLEMVPADIGLLDIKLTKVFAEVDRLRAENDSTFADLLHYSHLHWEDCPLDEEDCYLCEGYERIEANAHDRKAARR